MDHIPDLIDRLKTFIPSLKKLEGVPIVIDGINLVEQHPDIIWYTFDDPKYHQYDIANLIVGHIENLDRIAFITYYIYLKFTPTS